MNDSDAETQDRPHCRSVCKAVVNFLWEPYEIHVYTLFSLRNTHSREEMSKLSVWTLVPWQSDVHGNRRDCSLLTPLIVSRIQVRKRQWHPTPVLLPGNPRGGEASPWGHEESDTTERLHLQLSLSCIREGNGNPLQCSCLENARDRGTCWAAIYGVAQSRTRLKWLSSSSSRIQVCGLLKEVVPRFPPKRTLTSETVILTLENISVVIFFLSRDAYYFPFSITP